MLLQVSLFIILLASSGGTPYYITSSNGNNDTCFYEGRPLQPCSTLETLAATTSSYDFSDNFTLFFLPGSYVVQNTTHLNFQSMQRVTLRPLNENKGAIRINCSANMTINFLRVKEIIINSMEFYYCGGKGRVAKLYLIGVTGSGNIVQILNSSFIGNKGNAFHSDSSQIKLITVGSKFESHRAIFISSTLYLDIIAEISDTIFANENGALFFSARNSNTTIINSMFFNNNNSRAVYLETLFGSNVITLINCTFRDNADGAIQLKSGQFDSVIVTTIINSSFYNNTARNSEGGAITNDRAENITIINCIFNNNNATTSDGGAIKTAAMNVIITNSTFIANTCGDRGGAIDVSDSSGTLQLINVTFENNSAREKGGAIFIKKSSLHIKSDVYFIRNKAALGGALFVEDFVDYCNGSLYHPCFFNRSDLTSYIHFQDNEAREGQSLYGGFLKTCNNGTGIQQFTELLSNETIGHSITSEVIDICFCNDFKPDCDMRKKTLSTFPGKSVPLTVTTIDQYANYKPSTLDHCKGLIPNVPQKNCSYNTTSECTAVHTDLYRLSKENLKSRDFVLNYGGFCNQTNYLTVQIIFEECPRGFQLANSSDRCECDKRLRHPAPDRDSTIECNIDNQTIKNVWFYYKNETLNVWRYCSSDYCIKPTTFAPVKDENGSLCVHNRTKIVCGSCRNTFSIAIGNSKCIKCFNAHKYTYLWLVPLFAIMGLILVLGMLFLDLTVSIGLINGLIFYANILSISGLKNSYNCSIHPLLSVFISWINLDFGIETCFYSGMDMYQKTWLQFAFPLYIWLLVGLILILSHHSTRVMRLLGRKVIPVLATLFLLSYVKILRIVTTAFDFTTVLTADADNTSDELVPRKVWTSDGNVDYLSGKHIPLFIVALLFLVVLFLPYTLLLTFGQCLRTISRRKWLRWLRSTAFISIMDAYHAPFNRRHRYWTGLLLLIRCILVNITVYVAIYYTNTAAITNTFILLTIITGLFVLKTFTKDGIHKSAINNAFESFFLLNLISLSAIIIYLEALNGSNAPDMVCKCITASISIALATFCIIIGFHTFYKVKDSNTVQRFFHNKISTIRKVKSSAQNLPPEPETKTTTTYVQLREPLLESN